MPDKVLNQKPQFSVGEEVEVFIIGGTTYPGRVLNMRYINPKKTYSYDVEVRTPVKTFRQWFREHELVSAQESLKFTSGRLAAKPLQPPRWKPGDEAILFLGVDVLVVVRDIHPSTNPNSPARVHVIQKGTKPEDGRSWMVWESDLKIPQLDLFANWLEKSRDMYRVDTKPIGRDRKKVEGPFPRSVPNTWMELPMSKPLSKKTAGGKCQMCGSPMTGSACPRCKYTPTRKQFYGTKVTAGDVVPFPGKAAPVMEPAAPGEDGSDIADALLYQFDALKGDLQNLMASAQSWASESTDPQEIVRLKRMAVKLQAILKIIGQ